MIQAMRSPCNNMIETYENDRLDPAIPVTTAKLSKGANMEFSASKIGIEPLKLMVMTQDQPSAFALIIILSTNPKEYSQKNFVRIELSKEGSYTLRVQKQTLENAEETIKLFDVYGVNEKDVKGKECVICMTEMKDTMLLPCRHLVVCSRCSTEVTLRNKKCPVCRIGTIAINK